MNENVVIQVAGIFNLAYYPNNVVRGWVTHLFELTIFCVADPYGGGFIEQPTFGSADKEDNDEAGLDQYKEILKVAKRKEKKEKKNDIEMEISWDPSVYSFFH